MRPFLVDRLNQLFGTEAFSYLVPNYTIVLSATLVLCSLFAGRLARRRGLDAQHVYGAALWALPAGLLGARLLHVAYAHESYRGSLLAFLDPLQGDSVGYGGALAAAVAGLAYFRLRRLDPRPYLDVFAPAIGLAMFGGRLGCFADGCDFGAVTDGPLGVRFPPYSPASLEQAQSGWLDHAGLPSLPVHPAQLYLAVNGLVLALVVLAWQGRARDAVPGRAFALFWLLYACTRFGWELIRGDASRGFIGPLSTSQAISIPVALAALCLWWQTGRKRSNTATTTRA